MDLEIFYLLPIPDLIIHCMLGKNFSRQHFGIFFFFFPENRLWHFLQTVSLRVNLHEMSNPIFWKK